jgi:hypothetical protein
MTIIVLERDKDIKLHCYVKSGQRSDRGLTILPERKWLKCFIIIFEFHFLPDDCLRGVPLKSGWVDILIARINKEKFNSREHPFADKQTQREGGSSNEVD